MLKILTCPPESLETGETANDITGSGTFIDVMVYLTLPSVKVSPESIKNEHNQPQRGSCTNYNEVSFPDSGNCPALVLVQVSESGRSPTL